MNLIDFERILLEHRIRASIELLNKGLNGECFSMLGVSIEIRQTWGTFAGKTRKGWRWYVTEKRATKEYRKGFDVAPEYVIQHIVQAVDDMWQNSTISLKDIVEGWDYI